MDRISCWIAFPVSKNVKNWFDSTGSEPKNEKASIGWKLLSKEKVNQNHGVCFVMVKVYLQPLLRKHVWKFDVNKTLGMPYLNFGLLIKINDVSSYYGALTIVY